MLRLLPLTGLALYSLSAGAQVVYKHVDGDGNVSFTDQPPADAIRVEIQTPNSAVAPSDSAYPRASRPKPKDEAAGYKLAISSPANATIIAKGPGNFPVSASLSPSLRPGHKLQLLLDGEARQPPQTGTRWSLSNVFRGEHRLEVAVLDDKGGEISRSGAIVVFVFRPSSNR